MRISKNRRMAIPSMEWTHIGGKNPVDFEANNNDEYLDGSWTVVMALPQIEKSIILNDKIPWIVWFLCL